MRLIRAIRFRLWRWWFLKFRLSKIIHESNEELRRDYRAYLLWCVINDVPAQTFPEWCAQFVEESDE